MAQSVLAKRPAQEEEVQYQLQLMAMESFAPEPFVLGSIKSGMRAVNDGVLAPSRDLWQVDPTKVRVIPGFNPRVETIAYLSHVKNIVESMVSEGFYQDKPLAGVVIEENGEDVIYVYEGETRLKCSIIAISKGAKFAKVPISIAQEIALNDGSGKKRAITMADMLIAKYRGNEGRGFTLFEQGVIVKRLEEQEKVPRSDIARRLNVSTQQIGNLMKLMAADPEIRYLVATETISGSFAIDTLVDHGDDALRIIRAAMERAAASGSETVSAKHTPNHKFYSAVKRSAPLMYAALGEVKEDPNFDKLSLETQALLMQFLGEVDKLKDSEIEPIKAKSLMKPAQLALIG